MSEKKKSRMDSLATRVEHLESALATTFDMANKMRHIMTRIEGYSDAYDKYLKDIDSAKLDSKLNGNEGE
jgi:hypothetical protein